MKKITFKHVLWFIILAWIAFIIFNSCTSFKSIDQFDPLTDYSRTWDDSCTCTWKKNYDLIWADDRGAFTLFADSNECSRLITKESFNFELPFIVSFDIKANPSKHSLIGAWMYPVDDNSGFLVAEIDFAEIAGNQIIFSMHRGENRYGNHWKSQKHIDIDVGKWHRIKVKVKPFETIWYLDGKKVHQVKKDLPEIEYYLRLSIIETKRLNFPGLPDTSRFDIKNIKFLHFK